MILTKLLVLNAVFSLIRCFAFHSKTQHRIVNQISIKSKSTRLYMSLAERIRDSIVRKYDSDKVTRVLSCWNNFIEGKKLERYLDGNKKKVLQTADCFIEDLTGATFFDNSLFPWIPALETNYKVVLEELVQYESSRRGVQIDKQEAVAGDLLQQYKATGNGLQGDGEWLVCKYTYRTFISLLIITYCFIVNNILCRVLGTRLEVTTAQSGKR